ncbi:MAG: sugar transferase [Mogibacterium sp.]|nr:sugar transferase [Mogibacterium sp.]
MQKEEVRPYYDSLSDKRVQLCAKRTFDFMASAAMTVVLSPVLAGVAVAIKADSEGPVFYRQTRVTQYGKEFKIFKFRRMVTDADKIGSLVTVSNDKRVTKVGRFIRKYKIDELPQLFNILSGDMTLVGTRPEVPKYVDQYSDEMMATLLLPAGVTSLASIYYKDENNLLDDAEDVDAVYMETILPDKMKWNLKAIKDFSFFGDIKLMFMTVLAAAGKDYEAK